MTTESDEEYYEKQFNKIDEQLNYESCCFDYSFEEMPNDKFTDEKHIFITNDFKCYCYDNNPINKHSDIRA